MDKDINFSNLILTVFYIVRENPSARTFYSQQQRTISVLVKGATDLDLVNGQSMDADLLWKECCKFYLLFKCFIRTLKT